MPKPNLMVLACGLALLTGDVLAAPPIEVSPNSKAATPILRRAPSALMKNAEPLAPVRASLLNQNLQSNLASDTFTGEALVQDSAGAFYLDDTNPSTFLLDGLAEVGGTNLVNSGTFMFMSDAVTELAASTLVQIEMGAYDANGAPTLWVDSGGAGIGLNTWRFDVGTGAGGTDPIDMGGSFTIIESGMIVFASDGSVVGEFSLEVEASTTTALAGIATVGIGGEDIAGFDLFSIQIWWEIEMDATDPTDPTDPQPGTCVADLNGDGFVDIADISVFVTSFLAGCP